MSADEHDDLHEACKNNDIDEVRRCIAQGDAVNVRDLHDETPLHCAITRRGSILSDEYFYRQSEIIVDLVDAGADVNAVRRHGITPLHLSCALKLPKSVKMLIKKGADVNKGDNNNDSSLHKVLDVNYLTEYQSTVDIVGSLLEAGASLSRARDDGYFPLHLACIIKNTDAVKLLLKWGANVNAIDNKKELSLHKVLNKSYLSEYRKIVLALLEWGVDFRARNAEGAQPIHVACHVKDAMLVKLLLDKRVDINAVNGEGDRPIHIALNDHYQTDHRNIVLALIEAGAVIGAEGKGGFTPLHLAICRRDDVLVRFLLQNEVSVNAKSMSNDSPLHCLLNQDFATDRFMVDWRYGARHRDMLEALLEAGADARARAERQNTPLHYACHWADGEAIGLLISNGADAHARNCHGETPLHCLVGYQTSAYKVDIAKLLLEAGADINARNTSGQNPLSNVSKTGNYCPELVELLTANGAHWEMSNKNVHSYCQNGKNCSNKFKMACKSGGVNHVKRLFEHDIPFPLHLDGQPGLGRWVNMSLVVVMSRAGLDCTQRIEQDILSLLHLHQSDDYTNGKLLSSYMRFAFAINPYRFSFSQTVRMIINHKTPGNRIEELLGHYRSSVSLKALTVHAIRRRLVNVCRRHSILPRIKTLGDILPSSLVTSLRLPKETDTLLEIIKKNSKLYLDSDENWLGQ